MQDDAASSPSSFTWADGAEAVEGDSVPSMPETWQSSVMSYSMEASTEGLFEYVTSTDSVSQSPSPLIANWAPVVASVSKR